MILVGNQRGGSQDLAVHLMKPENEHEAYGAFRQDRKDMDELVFAHIKERKHIEIFKLRIQERTNHMRQDLKRDRQNYMRGQSPES
ncbi:MAG: hypothetical protein L3J04_08545 [Robiginitomaculum sp.]|nr:hypothetical protein [Robiginitomaculum sp.]